MPFRRFGFGLGLCFAAVGLGRSLPPRGRFGRDIGVNLRTPFGHLGLWVNLPKKGRRRRQFGSSGTDCTTGIFCFAERGDNLLARHNNHVNALRFFEWVVVRCPIRNCGWIKYDEISDITFADASPVVEAEDVCRQARHLAERFFPSEDRLLHYILVEDPREVSGSAGMGSGLIM